MLKLLNEEMKVVKKYLAHVIEDQTFCGKDILQAVQYYAEEHEVDTNYSKSYKNSWNLVNGVKEPKLAISNLNQEKRV